MQDERQLEFIQFTVRRGITSRLAHLKCTVRNAVACTSVRIARRRVISASEGGSTKSAFFEGSIVMEA